jgi:hypothetical protein
MAKQKPIDLSVFDEAVKSSPTKKIDLSVFDEVVKNTSVEKKNSVQPVLPTGTQPSKRGFEPFLPQVPTKAPSVLLSDEQKQQREKERIGERFETTLLNVPTEFGKVGQFMRSAKKVKDTLPQVPTMKPDTGGMVVIPQGEKIGESLRKGDTFQDVVTDKLTRKKTGLQKQIENAENAFRTYQGEDVASQVQNYIPEEETLKIKQELGFGEKMSNAGSNFVNRLERFPYNTSLALGQTLTTLLGEDYGSDAYRMATNGGNAEFHRMEAFDKLAKLDSEYKYSKGLIGSIQDFDLPSLAAAVTDAVGSLVSTVVTSAPTAGLGLYGDMVGGGLYDYNSTKANRLGISTNELYESGQNDFFVPAIINGIGAKLESVGLKGIKQGIMSNIKSKAGQKAGLIFHNSNKEGFTEWTQSGLEAYSNSLAQGKNAIQAGEEAVKEMFSKKGAESYLMGAVAAGAAIGGGRILKGIYSSKEKKKASEAIQRIEQQQQELSNPDISEESRVFIFDNIKNNIKEVVDAVYADVDESDNLSANQKKEVFELNKTIQALEIVANDPAVSEETKVSAQTKIDEIKSKLDAIIAAPEIKLAKPIIDTEEKITEEIRAAEKEFNETGDSAEYELKINDLNTRLENLVPVPEDAEIGKPEEVVAKDEVKENIRNQAKEEIANVLDDESLTEQQKEERVQQIVSAAKAQMKIKESDLKSPSLVVEPLTLSLPTPPDPFKVRLQELGYSDADISNMTIEQQQDIIENKRQAPEVVSSTKVDVVKENARQERIAQMQSELDEDIETPKPKQDAVQVETTSQVPVLTEAPVSEEVEQGKPEAKPKVVTEEGVKAKEVGSDKKSFSDNLKSKGFDVKPNGVYEKNGVKFTVENDKVYEVDNGEPSKYFADKTENSAIIENIEKINANKGEASKLLDEIIQVADEQGKELQLFVRASKGGELSNKQLTDWYERKGFKKRADGVMVRKPIKQTPAQEVEQLRAEEQAELKAAIPNADQYLTDGKVDGKKLTDPKDKKAFKKIYDEYNILITAASSKKEAPAPKQEAPAKAEPKLKPRVETRIKFAKAIELFNDISATKGGAKKRTLSSKRKLFLEQNPSIKYIDDNWRKISKQLEDKGLLKKEGNCP